MEGSIQYQLHAISTDYFFLANHKELGIPIIVGEEIKFFTETSGKEGIDKKQNIFQNTVIIKTFLNDKNGPLLLEVHFVFDFRIKGLTLDLIDNNINLPEQLLFTFRSISYSTARGLLVGKVSNTYLSGFILPLIDMKQLHKTEKSSKKDKNT